MRQLRPSAHCRASAGMAEPTWFQRLEPQRSQPADGRRAKRWSDKARTEAPPAAAATANAAGQRPASGLTLEGCRSSRGFGDPSCVYTCGCGHLGAELLCSLLRDIGVCTVLDVRELDHSTKRPWFNSDALVVTMRDVGITYTYIGQKEDDGVWADWVAQYVADAQPPVCLLGVRAIARECPRLRLSERLQNHLGWEVVHLQPSSDSPPDLRLIGSDHRTVYDRQLDLESHISSVTSSLEANVGLSGRWQDRVRARYRVVRWEEWDGNRHFPSVGDNPLAIELPWDTILLVLPGFLTQAEVYELQQASLPGAIDYSQPRRQVRNPDGSFTQFNEHHKEAWLSDEYDYRDTRRVAPPRAHTGQPLQPWTRRLLDRAGAAAKAPFNGLMCRWEPPGVHLKDGPHTYSTHCGWGAETVIGLMAVGATRVYHIHGIPWYYGRGRKEVVVVNMPLVEGTLMVLGGPLKERWLYAQPRDEERLAERIQFTLQLHADKELAKGAAQDCAQNWTEDCDGNGPAGAEHRIEEQVLDEAVANVDPRQLKDDVVEGRSCCTEAPTVTRSRWQRRAR